MSKFKLDYSYYENWISKLGYVLIGGIDEVGRGALAGPIVVAMCILPRNYSNSDIKDSKQLSASKREKLSKEIIKECIDYHIEIIEAKEVDLLNPKKASIIGMQRCFQKIKIKPDYLLIDAEQIDNKVPCLSIIKGDEKSISIAAAAILAKVFRDDLMIKFANKYPNYFFEKHKGYGTKIHMDAIEKYKPINGVHRFSYKPVKKHS